nr:MAG TPA: hypothetical protein [Caudoviricetes sp.]
MITIIVITPCLVKELTPRYMRIPGISAGKGM